MTVENGADDALSRLKMKKEALQSALLDAGAREGPDLGHWRCPWHGKDAHGSLSIFEKGGVWFFKCHGCDRAGTIVDVVVHADELDAKSAVKAVLDRYGDRSTITPILVNENEAFDLPDLAEVSNNDATVEVVNATINFDAYELPDLPSIPTAETTPVPAPARRSFARLEDLTDCLARALNSDCTRADDYFDQGGRLVMKVLRFDKRDGSGKSYRPAHPTADGTWVIGDPPGPFPLFNLPALVKDRVSEVMVCEGEKCVIAFTDLGILATTSAHGAKSAAKTDWSPLAGRVVTIWPDHDQAGRDYAAAVTEILQNLTPPARVAVIDPSKLATPIAEGDDVVDYLKAVQA
jgi:hypothetical protein